MKILCFPDRAIVAAGIFAAMSIVAFTPAPAIAFQKPSPVTGNALTVERVAAEPDRDNRSDSLRWNPEGTRLGWLRWVPTTHATDSEMPQREIWTLQSPTESESKQAKEKSALLLAGASITRALQGDSAAPHKSLDDDDINDNPFLLRDFAWLKGGNSLLLVGAKAIARYDLATGKAKVLTTGTQIVSDAALSPDETTVSFIRDHRIWLVSIDGGVPRPLTPAPATGILDGETDWDYRNELHLARGYEWSPDSTHIAYLETDDRAVAKYRVPSIQGEPREIAYPVPGGNLPLVRVFIRSASGGPAVPVKLGSTSNEYLPQFAWLPDSRHLAVERLDRMQHTLNLLLADSASGVCSTLITERDEYWINLSDILYFFHDGKRFLWSSEKTGFRHMYLYDIRGHELSQITHGDWEVTKLNSVNEATSTIYFTATEKSPLERHLYQIHLDGADQGQITRRPGTHQILFAPGRQTFADIHSSSSEPPSLDVETVGETAVHDLGVEKGANVPAPSDTAAQSGNAESARQRMTHHDQAPGATSAAPTQTNVDLQADQAPLPPLQPIAFEPIHLHLGSQTTALLLRPPDFDATRKYPVIVYLAGGPGEQLVRDAWGGATGLWMQLMAQKGFVVFALDNHGTTGRGHYFEHPIHLRLGAQELADQRDGLVYLSSLPYVDMKRLGVCGWGYGGFLVLHAMLDRPVAFKAGFAGAPIADWRLYDATFAERYLDDSVHHEDGWLASLAFENDSTKFFKGKLMVAQGTSDEFVHLENTFLIQSEMLKAGKSADLLLFPDSGHIIEEARSRLVLFQKMTDFFVINL
jgi:dipeptidyl-peptidase-4